MGLFIMNKSFNIKELFGTLEQEFPDLIITYFTDTSRSGVPGDAVEGMGSLGAYYPCSFLPALAFSMGFSHEIMPKRDTFGENTGDTVLSIGSSFSLKMRGDIRIGRYPLIREVFDSFLHELGKNDVLGDVPIIENNLEDECCGKVYVYRPQQPSHILPSLSAKFARDWDSTLVALRVWEKTVKGMEWLLKTPKNR